MWNWLGAAPPVIPDVPIPQDVEEGESSKEDVDKTKEISDKPDSGAIPTTNVKQVASQLGSYLYGFANVATNTASKLKETAAVHIDKSILGDFNRENEKFLQEKEVRRIGDGVPPWVGYHEESVMKRQILALSSDERNFLRSPPSGVDFMFNVEQKMPVAMATLKEDKNLEKMRFQLVPKKITEEKFWRNYFYRVSLVKQSTQLSTMADQDMKLSPRSSSTESLNKSNEIVEVDVHQENSNDDIPVANDAANEFISDSFQVDGDLSEEERNQMTTLSEEERNQMMGTTLSAEERNQRMGTTTSGDPLSAKDDADDWEFDKELQDEIDSFEMVNENTGDDNWEKEIEDLIELES